MSLCQVYPAPGEEQSGESKIDIIAVHGLDFVDAAGRCSVSSWREPSNGLGELWLNAFLQQQGLRARFFLYEYDSADTFNTGLERVSREADGILNQISIIRPKAAQHTPIIFLCQGLGGILVKQALVNASQNGYYAEIKTATMALLFFGTPHQLQHKKPPGLIETAFSFIPRSNTAHELHKSELLPELKEFHDQTEDYQFISFYGNTDEVVPFPSAVMNLAGSRETQVRLSSNHESLCCFAIGSDNYKKVTRNLLQLCVR